MSSASRQKKVEAQRAETSRTTIVSGRYAVYNEDARGVATGAGGRVLEIIDVLPGQAIGGGAYPEGTFTFVVTFVPHGKKKEI